jgi:hypothetical protein
MKRTVIALIAVVVLLACGLSAWAADYVDVIYLKNGSVVRGQIVEQIPNESVKIMTADGSVFVFKMSEIEKITKELATSGAGQGRPMKAFNILLNPLGFVQFGPMVQFEFRIIPGLYGIAHARVHGLGVLSWVLADTDEIGYYSFALGPGIRYFFVSKDVPHAPYVGFVAEFGYTPYASNIGYTDEYAGTAMYLTFAVNGGYRWRFGSFIVEVGGYAGASPTIFSQYHYLTSPSVNYEGRLPVTFFGMLELSIGWEL